MIWRSMPLAFRFSVAYALVFALAMVAGAQPYAAQPYGAQPYWAQPYQPPTQLNAPVQQSVTAQNVATSNTGVANVAVPNAEPRNIVVPPATQQVAGAQQYAAQQFAGQQFAGQQFAGSQFAARQYAEQQPVAQVAQAPYYYQPTPQAQQQQVAAGGMGYSLTPRLASNVGENGNYAPQQYAGPIESSIGTYGQTCDAGYDGSCDTCDIGAACNPCRPVLWACRAGFLFLGRDDENYRTFSFDSANEDYQLLDSRDTNFDMGYGAEGWISRFNCCRQRGFEIGYWGVYPGEETIFATSADVAGNLDSIFNFDQLDYNGGTADAFVNAAMIHRLRRESEIHNAEINWLWGLPPMGGGSQWQFRALAGFRYFRLEDNLEFAADTVDAFFTGAADELYYTIDTENNLYGFQLGGMGERQIGASRWSANWGAKAGIFGNQSESASFIGGAAGTATVNNGPNVGRAWDITNSKDDVAFLGELQAGFGYRFADHWRFIGEYRVVGVSGVALPTNQIYSDLRGLQDVEIQSTNGSLILHGAFVGAEKAY